MIKRYKLIKYGIIGICIITLVIVIFEMNFKTHIKFGEVSKRNIVSFKINTYSCENISDKEIKDKEVQSKIIDLINSLKIIDEDENLARAGGLYYGIEIHYLDGTKFKLGTLPDYYVSYSINDKWHICTADKSIYDELKRYYNKNDK